MEKKKCRYTIIIPAYNAEKTLARCLDSLLIQNYHDMELILINDGSIDNTDAICRDYSSRSENILYISKPNGGVSAARNVGLDAASGEYILFVDSDDYVNEDYFATLDKTINDYSVDLIQFSYSSSNGFNSRTRQFEPYTSQNLQDFYSALCQGIYKKTINPPWNKVFLRSIIMANGIRFHENITVGEDRLFNISYALNCQSIHISDLPLYTVNTENEQSLSRKIRPDLHEQFNRLNCAILSAVTNSNIDLENKQMILSALNFMEVRSVYSESKRMHKKGIPIGQRLRIISNLCDAVNGSNLTIPSRLYCKLLYLPVKLRLTLLLDLVGWKLAH